MWCLSFVCFVVLSNSRVTLIKILPLTVKSNPYQPCFGLVLIKVPERFLGGLNVARRAPAVLDYLQH